MNTETKRTSSDRRSRFPALPEGWYWDSTLRLVDMDGYSRFMKDANGRIDRERVSQCLWNHGYESHAAAWMGDAKKQAELEECHNQIALLEARVRNLTSVLEDCKAYFSNRADADHNGTRFVANEEMQMEKAVSDAIANVISKS